jgi:hypothetical protein
VSTHQQPSEYQSAHLTILWAIRRTLGVLHCDQGGGNTRASSCQHGCSVSRQSIDWRLLTRSCKMAFLPCCSSRSGGLAVWFDQTITPPLRSCKLLGALPARRLDHLHDEDPTCRPGPGTTLQREHERAWSKSMNTATLQHTHVHMVCTFCFDSPSYGSDDHQVSRARSSRDPLRLHWSRRGSQPASRQLDTLCSDLQHAWGISWGMAEDKHGFMGSGAG